MNELHLVEMEVGLVPEISASVTFCEDIRVENNGKTQLIGIWGKAIIFDTFPAVLGSLCAIVKIKAPTGMMPHIKKVHLEWDGGMIEVVPHDNVERMGRQRLTERPKTFTEAEMTLRGHNILFEKSCIARAFAELDDKRMYVGGIKITSVLSDAELAEQMKVAAIGTIVQALASWSVEHDNYQLANDVRKFVKLADTHIPHPMPEGGWISVGPDIGFWFYPAGRPNPSGTLRVLSSNTQVGYEIIYKTPLGILFRVPSGSPILHRSSYDISWND